MYYEVYLDLYFLENLVLNSLILVLSKSLLHCRKRPGRTAAAAIAGAGARCLLLVLPVRENAALLALLEWAAWFCMAALGMSGDRRDGAVPTVLAVTALLGGLSRLLMELAGFPFPAAAALGGLAVYLMGRSVGRLWERRRFLCQVTLQNGGRSLHITGLIDSGNGLAQPLTGRPVQVLELACARELLDERACRELDRFLRFQADDETSGKFSYIPYRTVGGERGLLTAVMLDGMEIKQGQNTWSARKVLTALSEGAVSGRGEYQVILHPGMFEDCPSIPMGNGNKKSRALRGLFRRSGGYDDQGGCAGQVPAAGCAVGDGFFPEEHKRYPLYWGKRGAAVASGDGGGGRSYPGIVRQPSGKSKSAPDRTQSAAGGVHSKKV